MALTEGFDDHSDSFFPLLLSQQCHLSNCILLVFCVHSSLTAVTNAHCCSVVVFFKSPLVCLIPFSESPLNRAAVLCATACFSFFRDKSPFVRSSFSAPGCGSAGRVWRFCDISCSALPRSGSLLWCWRSATSSSIAKSGQTSKNFPLHIYDALALVETWHHWRPSKGKLKDHAKLSTCCCLMEKVGVVSLTLQFREGANLKQIYDGWQETQKTFKLILYFPDYKSYFTSDVAFLYFFLFTPPGVGFAWRAKMSREVSCKEKKGEYFLHWWLSTCFLFFQGATVLVPRSTFRTVI